MKHFRIFQLFLVALILCSLTSCASGPSNDDLRRAYVNSGHLELSAGNAKIEIKDTVKCQDLGLIAEVWMVDYVVCVDNNCSNPTTAYIGRNADENGKIIDNWVLVNYNAPCKK